MIKQTLMAAVLCLGFAVPALASHCPLDAKAIDSALERSTLDMDTKSEIRALRDQGMELHNSGQHRQSEQTLAKAMRMLLEGKLK